MAQTESTYVEYPMFKGLQKPLEFLGLQGRYITWAAITAGTGILGFMLMFSLFGFLAGLCRSSYQHRYRADSAQAEKRSAHKERVQRHTHLCQPVQTVGTIAGICFVGQSISCRLPSFQFEKRDKNQYSSQRATGNKKETIYIEVTL